MTAWDEDGEKADAAGNESEARSAGVERAGRVRLASMERFLQSISMLAISDVVTGHIFDLGLFDGNESEAGSAGVVAGRVGRLGREEAVQVTPKSQISCPALHLRQTSNSVGPSCGTHGSRVGAQGYLSGHI